MAVGFYNPDCILVNLSKIFGGIIPTYLKLTVCIPMFHKSYFFNWKKLNLNEIYRINFDIPTSEPF